MKRSARSLLGPGLLALSLTLGVAVACGDDDTSTDPGVDATTADTSTGDTTTEPSTTEPMTEDSTTDSSEG
jgi:hypothetical protein